MYRKLSPVAEVVAEPAPEPEFLCLLLPTTWHTLLVSLLSRFGARV